MKKFLFLVALLSTHMCYAQDFNIFCNEDECGGLDPSWQLVGTETEACEGETFFLRSAESVPLNNIDTFIWTLRTLEAIPQIITQETYADTTWFSYSYNAPEEPDCQGSGKIDLEVILTITSPNCTTPNGDVIESCRYSAEPLSIQLEPIARFSHSTPKCAGEPIEFTDESCYATSYLWDFGNGNTSPLQNPTNTYNTPGTYTVSLTATNECGSDTETQTINVLGIPETELILINGGEGCAPDRQQITFTPNQWISGPTGYQRWEVEPEVGNGWCFIENLSGVGDTIICQPDPQYLGLYHEDTLDMSILSPGEYEVTLFYGNDCVDEEVTETIYIYARPTISALDDINGCDQVTVCFDELELSLGGDITNYSWTFTGSTGNNYSNDSDPDFGCRTFNGAGTISLELEGVSPCPNATRTANINVITTGTVSVGNISAPICQNDDPIYINPSQNGGRYFNNGTEITYISGDTLYPSGLSPGDYNLTYIIGFGTACPAEDNFSFSILEGPSIDLGEYNPYCQMATNFDPIIGMTSDGDIDSWSWQICDANGNVVEMSNAENPTFDINTPGEYSVKVSVSSMECGTVSDTSSLFIQADEEAMISPVNTPLCQGSSPIMLEATPPGGTWSGADSDGIFDPAGLSPGMYPITYSITSGACSSSADITIEVVASAVVMAVDTFFCITDMPAMLEVFPTGGTFSGD